MRFGVVIFPASNCDRDCVHVLHTVLGQEVEENWHEERSLDGLDAVVLPGGFAYGDYLRAGAVAARAPVMTAVRAFAQVGGPVLGICNGFQILLEAGRLLFESVITTVIARREAPKQSRLYEIATGLRPSQQGRSPRPFGARDD